ncbi:DNA topoisomerase 3 [uncultured Porphyromonas sp.]|uniref:DNA topoisomerase 3 n=1 Tax=uncultured Porphyromonas sp. TaxID=159274 RepID=UPI0026147D62|nr:DNA topoisomerase 3 [uncultured Porphyromonas sp.]
MKVCIAEKPSVARSIAAVLGANEAHDGYMEGNGYRVTWTFGHLCELKEPAEYATRWRRWSLVHLPIVPERFGIKLKKDNGIKHQFDVICRLVSEADEVINCGDAGQEGELIQRWVLQLADCKAPIRRLWLSSMTEEAIREGFDHLHESAEYERLYYAGMTRAIGDWLLGINATRLYTLKYRSGDSRRLLSVGRVQTPTLALIVERAEEIEHFVPEPYWEIKTIYRETAFATTTGRYSTVDKAQKILDKITGKPFSVTKVTKKKGKETPPHLFDLTSLQIEANKKLGLSADETLRTIQALYERKLVTYPRVDTTYITEDVYAKCPEILNNLYRHHRMLSDLISPLGHKKLRKLKSVVDNSKVTDHHAIIPTGEVGVLTTNEEGQIYDLIARRFIAAFYPDMQYEQTTVQGAVEGVRFRANGRVITDPGWQAVTKPDEDKESADDEPSTAVMPSFVEGEQGPHKPQLQEKQTRPPRAYTEATLLRAMETAGKLVESEEMKEALKQNGIGRPSTRAAIIETLLSRGYIRKQRKTLLPTPLGRELIHIIRDDMLKSVELTGQWERKLRQIESGEYDARQFISDLTQKVTRMVAEVIRDPRTMSALIEEEKSSSSGGKAKKKKRQRRSSSKSDRSDDIVPHEGDLCPKCHEGHLLRGRTALGCSRYAEGCDYRSPLPQEEP